MTLHINEPDFLCQNCKVPFIPFKKNITRPNCGIPTDEHFDFIPSLIISMKAHKMEYGSFMPDCWIRSSLTEHIQQLIFRIFDSLNHQQPKDGEGFIIDVINKGLNFRDQEYLRKHTEDIALAVYEIYKDDWTLKSGPGISFRMQHWLLSHLPRWLTAYLPF
jgi:hypothetical protein